MMRNIKTLVFAGGWFHKYKKCGRAAVEALSSYREFDITYVEKNLDVLAAPGLDPYDLIVFFYTRGKISDAQKNGLLNFIASGKGYVGFHSAADSFRKCPEYRTMIGGHFVTHPRSREYQVNVINPEHPITKGLTEFTVKDEQYILDFDQQIYSIYPIRKFLNLP